MINQFGLVMLFGAMGGVIAGAWMVWSRFARHRGWSATVRHGGGFIGAVLLAGALLALATALFRDDTEMAPQAVAAEPAKAKPFDQAAAKFLAQALAAAMDDADAAMQSPAIMADNARYIRMVDAPLSRAMANWPEDIYANPYQGCYEAALALQLMGGFARSTNEFNRDQAPKWAAEYLDKRERCNTSIETGTYTERRAK